MSAEVKTKSLNHEIRSHVPIYISILGSKVQSYLLIM